MYDPVPVPLKYRPDIALLFRFKPSSGMHTEHGVGTEILFLPLFQTFPYIHECKLHPSPALADIRSKVKYNPIYNILPVSLKSFFSVARKKHLFLAAYIIDKLRVFIHRFISRLKRRHLKHMPHSLENVYFNRNIFFYHLFVQHCRIVQ